MTEIRTPGRDFSGITTRILVDHIRALLGEAGVGALLAESGETRPLEVLCDDTSWTSYAEFRALLEVAARMLTDLGGLEGIGTAEHVASATSPEVVETLLAAFSSPVEMAVTGAGNAHLPIMIAEAEALSPSHLRFHSRLADGFEPFPELCQFMKGMQPQLLRLFGFRSWKLEEEACQCRGDEACVLSLSWADEPDDDLEFQLESARTRTEIAERRLEAFQETVHDIVAADDLDELLGRVVRRTARAVRAPGFVLVVDKLVGRSRVYAEGLSTEAAEAVLADVDRYLSVEVRSARRHYGRLIVVAPTDSVRHEQAALDSYARLAATALDSAFAVEEARRQAETAEALLQLSTSLAELTSAGDLAAKVVRAIPAVIDCDCAVVVFVSDGVGRVAAHHGYPPELASHLEHLELKVAPRELGDVNRNTRDGVAPLAGTLMDDVGLKAFASAPLIVDGTTVGLLVAGVRDGSKRILDDPKLAERFAGLAGQATVALRNGRLLDQIRHQSLHDPLTDLPNRALIMDRAEQLLARSRRARSTAAAMFIDLDGFKEINDTLGHAAGDDLLRQVAVRLRAVVRANDTVGRMGGDEFVVLTEMADDDTGAEAVAERIIEVLGESFQLTGRDRPVTVAASIGIAQGDRPTAGELLRDADIALYRAKAAGKGCQRVFEPQMQAELAARAELGERLADAIVNQEFFLLYQPIVDLSSEIPTGVEALLRWNHPQLGVVSPETFIPMLEETGLIIDVGRWVLRQACDQAAELRRAGFPADMSVNASVRQVERIGFVDDVRDALEASAIPPSSLVVEITETAIMRDADAMLAVLAGIKALGVRIAIDDFGTGYSSLGYLRQFPVDAIKIDRTFVDAESPGGKELVHSLVRLGKSLKLETFAEGIEHRDQLERLRLEECQSGQGFLFARPLPADTLVDFFTKRSTAAPARMTQL